MRLLIEWGAAESGVNLPRAAVRKPKRSLEKVKRLTLFSDIIMTAQQGQCNQYLRMTNSVAAL
jgi:hypothetical protein